MTQHRWRVDCRKDRNGWRTLLSEAYDTLTEAEAAQLVYAISEDWDSVEVVAVEVKETATRRLVALGRRVMTREDVSELYL